MDCTRTSEILLLDDSKISNLTFIKLSDIYLKVLELLIYFTFLLC